MADTNSELKTRLQLLKEIENRNNRIEAAMKNSAINQELLNRYLEVQKTKNKELISELKDINKARLQGLSQAESSLSSLGSMYSNIEKLERERIKSTLDSGDLTKDQLLAFNEMASINQKIAQLGRDDISQRAELVDQYDDQLKKAGDLNDEGNAVINNLTQQNKLALQHSQLTKKQKAFLEKQLTVYEGIKDTIGGVLETASLLTSTVGGIFGGALIGAGAFINKLGETRMALGGISEVGTTALSFIDDNAVSNAKELASQFGGINNVSSSLQASTSLISTNMGISGTEAASLLGDFSRLNDGSQETALNLIKSSQEFAKQNGIIPADLMSDLAGSAEEFALYGKDGGKNLIEAAGAARKLGVNLKTMTTITDSLLDFESSITSELELGAMLGKNINLDKARALAYAGEETKAVEETLNALGGIEAFNKMDIFSKRKTAQLLGISVSELSKMVSNQEEAAKLSGTMEEKFNITGEALSAGLNKYLGTTVQGLGGALIAIGQMGTGLSSVGGIAKTAFAGVKKLLGGGAEAMDAFSAAKAKGLSDKQILSGFGGKEAKDMMMDKGKDLAPDVSSLKPDTSVSDNLNKTAGSKGPKASNLLKGAAAILILSAALFVAAKAFQEFGSVTWPAVGMGLVSLAGLAGIAMILGKAQGEMIKGATAVAILGAALIPFAFSMSLIAGLDIGSVMAAAAGLVIFSAAIFGLGALMSSGVGAVVFGAGLVALAGLGVSMMVLGGGLLVAAAGFQAIGGSMGSVVSLIAQVKDVLGGMFQYIAPIAALSLALVGLAGALAYVGVAGIAALPGLMAVAAVGTIAMGVGSLLGFGDDGGVESSNDSDLLSEIKGLRQDLTSGKVGVYMDGVKVTSAIAKVYDRVGSNAFIAT